MTTACRESATSLTDTEQQLLAFVKEHVPEGRCPLAGNTAYMDKRFLEQYMPQLVAYLHYRIVDVSSVKELCRYVGHILFLLSVSNAQSTFMVVYILYLCA